jgi:outer membrane protein assembly factor BamA
VYFNSTGSALGVSNTQTLLHPSIAWVAPTIALTHDNSLFGFVGPFAGSRYRFQVSPAIGGWKFTGALADMRRYFFARPFTLAFRGLFYGRVGRDASQFPVLLGNPDFVRGYTAGSLIRHECYQQVQTIAPFIGGGGVGLTTGCPDLDQLIGSRIGVANVELRFPLTRTVALGFLPIQLPPIEGAIFYDVGLAWESGSVIVGRRSAGESPETYRTPLQSWGGSIRVNFIGIPLRFDYAKPLTRTYKQAYWTISIGPTF